MRPKEDVEAILAEMGHSFEIRRQEVTDTDPIYGGGSASYTVGTVEGIFDFYQISREVLGLGKLEIGDARIITKGGLKIESDDLVCDTTGTFAVNNVKNYNFKGTDAYSMLEVTKVS